MRRRGGAEGGGYASWHREGENREIFLKQINHGIERIKRGGGHFPSICIQGAKHASRPNVKIIR